MSIRVGNVSGYYGDRPSALHEQLAGGPLDFATGDYLAELTMLILGRDRMKDADLGYAKSFVRQLTESLRLARELGVRIVVNAGGLNPAGLARRVRQIASDQGLEVAVAHVEGDDLRSRAQELARAVDLPGHVVAANAYLGAFGIASALDRGAEVVVTGRVTDASLVMGPAIHAFGWGRDDLDPLAGALVAGHVVECGTQATGGNFSGFTSVDLSRPLGFPVAQIEADGSSVITKHDGTGGVVDVDTVTAQLLYEVGGPAYLNPDVVADLASVELSQEGPDRVRIGGVRGDLPPADVKIGLNALGGFRNGLELMLTGLDIPAKAAWARTQLESALAEDPPDEVVWQLDRTDAFDPPTQAQATSYLRCHVRSSRPEPVGRPFSDAAVHIALASYPGFTLTAPPSGGVPFGVYRPAYLPQGDVPHVVIHADGQREEIAAPARTQETAEPPVRSRPTGQSDAGGAIATVRAPLGELAYARSGDKGADANVGVWIPASHPRRDDAYGWLRDELTADRVAELLPEAAGRPIDVHHLDRLRGINIVLRGLLGEGVASSTRIDPQAKAVGEWLRSRVVSIPEELLA